MSSKMNIVGNGKEFINEVKDVKTFNCTMDLGEEVRLNFPSHNIVIEDCYVRTITFTKGKVRFSIFLEKEETTLHNIDSTFVEKIDNPNFIDFHFDNYS